MNRNRSLADSKVLVVSNMYPSRCRPQYGVFVADATRALEDSGLVVRLVVSTKRGEGFLRNVGKYAVLAIRTLWRGILGGYDVVHAHYVFPSGLFGMFAACLRRVPLVVFSHGSDVLLASWRWPIGALTQLVARRADVIVAPSQHHEQYVRAVFKTVRRTAVIPIGVDTTVFRPGDRSLARERIGLERGARWLVFIGALDENKGAGCVDIVSALRDERLSECKLLVIGSGPWLGRILRIIADEELLDRVIIQPPQPRDAIIDILRAADVVVVPSRRESLGLVALEAEACATPVVAAKTGALVEHVIPGRNGELFESGDVASLTDSIVLALARLDESAYSLVFDEASYGVVATRKALQELTDDLLAAS